MGRNDLSVSLIVGLVGAGFLVVGGFILANSLTSGNSDKIVTGFVVMLIGAGIVTIAKKLE